MIDWQIDSIDRWKQVDSLVFTRPHREFQVFEILNLVPNLEFKCLDGGWFKKLINSQFINIQLYHQQVLI